MKLVQVPDGLPCDGGDDIAGLKPSRLTRAARLDADDERASLHRQLIGVGHLGRHADGHDAEEARTTRPWASRVATIGLMVLAEMANPMPWAEAISAVLIPTTSPLRFKRGPPELPGLMAASVWMRLWSIGRPGCSMVRPSALTTPTVTVGPPSIQSGLPIATTVSPTASVDEAPSRSAGGPALDLEDRQIGKPVGTDHGRPEDAPVGQRHLDLLGAFDHMIVRQHVPRTVEKEAPSPARESTPAG